MSSQLFGKPGGDGTHKQPYAMQRRPRRSGMLARW